MSLRLRPITLKVANEFVKALHRHHSVSVGHKFSIGVESDDKLVGVAITGRPVARGLDKGLISEVTRLCTNGTKNACSILYAASARASMAMGYLKIVTYTLFSEEGASLRAAGWVLEAKTTGGSWSCESRPRDDKAPLDQKLRYAKALYSLKELKSALQAVWAVDTSYSPEMWTEDKPSTGHCAVTSLVVQDRFGGEVLCGTVDGVSHYWNRLHDGQVIDLTRDQFSEQARRSLGVSEDRDRILSVPDTVQRYNTLNKRLKNLIGV